MNIIASLAYIEFIAAPCGGGMTDKRGSSLVCCLQAHLL